MAAEGGAPGISVLHRSTAGLIMQILTKHDVFCGPLKRSMATKYHGRISLYLPVTVHSNLWDLKHSVLAAGELIFGNLKKISTGGWRIRGWVIRVMAKTVNLRIHLLRFKWV